MIIDRDESSMRVMNKDGEVKRIAFATDAQMRYLNTLRVQLGKQPLKGRPALYAAKKQIDAALKQIEENEKKPVQTSIL